jgi:hypothetical protein
MSKIPRTPRDTVLGIVYLPRMIEKIRLHAGGELHPEYHANLGIGFDLRACAFLGVPYEELVVRVNQSGSDEEIAEWCFQRGRRPGDEQIEIWNAFMEKRGWRDPASALLVKRKTESGFTSRDDIMTFFDYIDADEGR